jgi:hypothetical protein
MCQAWQDDLQVQVLPGPSIVGLPEQTTNDQVATPIGDVATLKETAGFDDYFRWWQGGGRETALS